MPVAFLAQLAIVAASFAAGYLLRGWMAEAGDATAPTLGRAQPDGSIRDLIEFQLFQSIDWEAIERDRESEAQDARNAAFEAGHAAGFDEGLQHAQAEHARDRAQAGYDGYQEGIAAGSLDGIGRTLRDLTAFIEARSGDAS